MCMSGGCSGGGKSMSTPPKWPKPQTMKQAAKPGAGRTAYSRQAFSGFGKPAVKMSFGSRSKSY